MKKFLSLIAAVAMLSMVSVTAFATDYSEDPSDKPDYSDVVADGDGTVENPVEVPTADLVEEAITAGDPVYITDDAVLTEDVVATIANAEEPVTFVAPTGITIKIDPATITEVSDFNLNFEVEAEEDNEVTTAPSVKITPAMSGDFGMTVELTIPAEAIPAEMDVEAAHLLYVADDGTVSDMGAIVVGDDGSFTVAISHASYYLVTDDLSVVTDGNADTSKPADTTANNDTDNPNTGVAATSVVAIAAVASAAVAFKARKKK